MKKIYSLLALFMFFVAGAVQAQETAKFWELVDEENPLTEITPGQTVVIKEGENTDGWSDGGYLSSTSSDVVFTISEGCVYQFEEVGMDGEHKTYAIKNVANGKYISDGEDLYVKSIEDAFICTARLARAVAQADMEAETDKGDVIEAERSGDAEGKTFVFYNSAGGYYMGFVGAPSFMSYTDTNNWYLFEVAGREKTGRDELGEVFSVQFPNGIDGLFTPGTGTGTVDQAAYDAFVAAYNAAVALYEDATASDEKCAEAAKAVMEAYEAVNATFQPVVAGYYVFINQRSQDTLYMNAAGNVYSDNTNAVDPATITLENANYIWQLEAAEPEEDAEEDALPRFYFRNFATGRYVGTLVGQTGSGNPSTAAPEVTFEFEAAGGGFFLMADNAGGLGHNAGNGELCKWNDRNASGNWWKVITVPAEVIGALEGEVLQTRLNQELTTLYDESSDAYYKGRVMIPSAEATPDSNYDNDGIFTYSGTGATQSEDDANAFTNAPCYNEGANGYVSQLFDGDLNSYFHTAWDNPVLDPHYLQINLDEPIKDITFKYTKRNNNGGHPNYWIIYGADSPEGPWVKQGKYTLPYQYACLYPEAETESANRTGILAVNLDKEYQYLRLEGRSHGIFWHMAELRLYEGAEYDAANSPYEQIDAEIREAFEAARAAAEPELESGKATQETIDKLQTALDNFLEVYPDTMKLVEALDKAKAMVDGAVESDELGYYAVGSIEELEAAILEAEALKKENMTFEEISAARKIVEDAMVVFAGKLNMPEDGKVYFIQSQSEGEPANYFLYGANSHDEANVRYGYYDSETGTGNADGHLQAMWKCVKNEDGTYSYQNLHTGLWLGNPEKNNEKVLFSAEPVKVAMQGAVGAAGAFNFVMAEGIYANAQPGTGLLVTWNEAQGFDNSAFGLIEVEEMPTQSLIDCVVNEFTILCLPYSVYCDGDYTEAYSVLGLKDGNLQLGLISFDEEIPAGTPFIYYSVYEFAEDEEEFYSQEDLFSLSEVDPANMTYNYEPALVNGLQGTMAPVELEGSGFGYFKTDNEGKLKVAVTDGESTKKIGANSGYFVEVAATDLDGDYVIPVDGTLTGINAATVVKNENVNVYSLSGVKVRQNVKAGVATNGLPKGLYIVGNKKVLVK